MYWLILATWPAAWIGFTIWQGYDVGQSEDSDTNSSGGPGLVFALGLLWPVTLALIAGHILFSLLHDWAKQLGVKAKQHRMADRQKQAALQQEVESLTRELQD